MEIIFLRPQGFNARSGEEEVRKRASETRENPLLIQRRHNDPFLPGAWSFRLTEKRKLFEDRIVIYRLLGDAVIFLHFLWILFILFGLLVGVKYGRLIWVHLGGLVFTLILNIGGWFCPLTYLENHLYILYNPQRAHAGSLIGQYLQKLIYLDVDEAYLRISAVIWVAINLGGYALLFRKRKSVYH